LLLPFKRLVLFPGICGEFYYTGESALSVLLGSILTNKEITMKKAVIASAVAAVVSAGLSAGAVAAEKPKMEKCYGVVKAGKNDCGIPGKNACSGHVKVDDAPDAWIFLPKGSCDKITGGSTKPKE
jgi:uncharacterized membrane protein